MKTYRHVIRLIRYGWKAGPFIMMMVVALNMLLGIAPTLELWLTERLITEFGQIDREKWFILVLPWVAALIVVKFSAVGLEQLGEWFQANFRESLKLVIKRDIFRKTHRTSYEQFEAPGYQNQLSRSIDGMEGVYGGLIFQVFKVIEALVVVIGLCWIIMKVHWAVPLIVLLGSLPVIRAQTQFNESMYATDVEQTTDYRVMSYVRGLLLNKDASMEVRIFGFGDYLIQKWSRLRSVTYGNILRIEARLGLKLIAYKGVHLVAFGGSLLWLLYQLLQGHVSLAESIVVVFALVQLQERWEWCVRWSGWIHEDYNRLVKDLFAFLDLEETKGRDQVEKQEVTKGRGRDRDRLMNGDDVGGVRIRFDDVSFAYPGAERDVLKHIQLDIREGEKVMIVGENGSGKTTLIKLLLGFYTPSSGSITVNDRDLREDPSVVWRQVSVLYQDFVRYHLRLRDNIGFGHVERIDDLTYIREGVMKYGADQVLQRLDRDVERYLGPTFGGGDLSGGQWQKVATARAFIRGSELIVLDEPTAALDPNSESELYEQFIEHSHGKTAIIISHRLGIARFADRIIVLKDGEIVEEGSHDRLLRNRGEYYEMWTRQASLYQREAAQGTEVV